jgi:16S rRNA processing protein RimM
MDYYRIGLMLRPHGIRGEVKLLPLTDDVNRFRELSDAYIEVQEGCYRKAVVRGAKIVPGDSVIVSIEGVNTMDEAESLRNRYLCVDREHAVALPEDTYFVSDLIGCKVFSSIGEELGTLSDVYETNANDVYVVTGKRKLSVPALKKLLSEVDIYNRRVVFDSDVLSEVGLFED